MDSLLLGETFRMHGNDHLEHGELTDGETLFLDLCRTARAAVEQSREIALDVEGKGRALIEEKARAVEALLALLKSFSMGSKPGSDSDDHRIVLDRMYGLVFRARRELLRIVARYA